ncbi:MAG: MYXO-CTERM sorting domain-containing protein [Polyangiaceae bacterium]
MFDGLDLIGATQLLTATLDIAAPTSTALSSSLAVVVYDGENELDGDAQTFAGTTLSNGSNNANNFFNSTQSNAGAPVASGVASQLTGNPDTMAGYDLDIADVTPFVTSGLSTVDMSVAAGNDAVLLGIVVTSVSGCAANTDCPDANTACDTNTGNCVATCTGNGDCAEPTPVCDVDGGICVDCLADTDCEGDETCNTTTHVCEGGGTGGAGGGGSASGGAGAGAGAGVGGAGTGATGTGSGENTTGTGGNDFSGLAAEGGGCSLSSGGSAKQTALLFGVFAAAAGLVARRRRRS